MSVFICVVTDFPEFSCSCVRHNFQVRCYLEWDLGGWNCCFVNSWTLLDCILIFMSSVMNKNGCCGSIICSDYYFIGVYKGVD